jgi:hypothetical protein
LAPETPDHRECSVCGASFRCGALSAEERCWCMAMPPLVLVPGRGCLCRACLEEELREKSKERT